MSLHPSLLKAALGEELWHPNPPISLASIAARAMHIPMRKTNKHLSGKSSGTEPPPLMHAQAMRHLLNMMGVSAGEVSLPGFKLLNGRGGGQDNPMVQQPPLGLSGQMQSRLPLPLMPSENMPKVSDLVPPPTSLPPRVPLEASLSTPNASPPPPDSLQVKQPSVVSAAEMLTRELQQVKGGAAKGPEGQAGKIANVDEEGEEESPHGQPKAVQKPAKQVTSKKKQAVQKPAKQVTSKKEQKSAQGKATSKAAPRKTCTKSKEAVPKASVTKGHQGDLALRRAAGIPTALLRKFASGCSRCRSRPFCTKSCWALRGYDLS